MDSPGWTGQSRHLHLRSKPVSGDVIVDVMRTHPVVIIGGVVQENPFFVDPEDFLAELRERPRAQLKRLG